LLVFADTPAASSENPETASIVEAAEDVPDNGGAKE
jgi:hypothetical protein